MPGCRPGPLTDGTLGPRGIRLIATRLGRFVTTSPALTSFAARRFSPLQFDPEHVASNDEVDVLLEAAGRAPSAGNSQPWAFIVGRRGDGVHAKLVRHLSRSSSAWAPGASLLVANLSQRFVEDTEMDYSEFAHYDLGQAVAHLTFQAHTMGMSVHQFRAFDQDAVAREFSVPSHWEVTTMAAIGVPTAEAWSMTGAGTSRERRSRTQITWARGS